MRLLDKLAYIAKTKILQIFSDTLLYPDPDKDLQYKKYNPAGGWNPGRVVAV